LEARLEAPALAAALSGRLMAWRSQLGPRLAAALEARVFPGGLPDEGALLAHLSRVAQPVAWLPIWVAEALADDGTPPGAAAALDAAEASMFGYLYARAVDAVVDGDGLAPVDAQLLADALFARHQVALAGVAPAGAPFWPLFQRRWLAAGEALLLERALARGGGVDAAGFERVLDRSRPLLLPGAALLARCGRWGWLTQLSALVDHSTRAAQLFDDLLDVQEDLAAGNCTWVARRFGGAEDPAGVGYRLIVEGGFDAVVAEVRGELSSAAALAGGLGMARGQAALLEAGERAERTRQETLDRVFAQLFGSP
jgi:hypothetical protein